MSFIEVLEALQVLGLAYGAQIIGTIVLILFGFTFTAIGIVGVFVFGFTLGSYWWWAVLVMIDLVRIIIED